MRGRIFYSICFGFIIGIFFSSFSKFGFSIFSLTIVLSFSLLLSQIFTKNKAIITLIAVFIISFGLGTLRYSVADISRGEAVFEFLEQKITAVGEVIDEPRLTQQNQQIILQPDKINGQNVAENDKIIVSTASYPVVNYGDKISVTGVLKKPENFKNNNRTFDYVNYLSKDDIFYQISFANVKVVSSDNGSYLISTLLKIKNSFLNSISRVLPDPESSYLGGVLLGAKSSLPKDWQEYFRLAGVSHLVALSGYNISIVAEYIVLMFSFLSQRLALSFGGFGIVLFVLMTGASPTAIRAGIMACLVIWAKFIGRQYNIHRAIIVAAVLLLLFSPKALVYDFSFQLSFLATLGIVYLSPIVKDKLKFITERFSCREILATTISAQLTVLPLILYQTGWFSFVSLFANFMILPFVPLTMLFGFLTGLAGFAGPIIAGPLAWITYLLLHYQLWVTKFWATKSWAGTQIDLIGPVTLFILYLILFIWIFRNYRKHRLQSNDKI